MVTWEGGANLMTGKHEQEALPKHPFILKASGAYYVEIFCN